MSATSTMLLVIVGFLAAMPIAAPVGSHLRLPYTVVLVLFPPSRDEGFGLPILERIDTDRLGLLARQVRSRHAWEAVYRERIAPLLALD